MEQSLPQTSPAFFDPTMADPRHPQIDTVVQNAAGFADSYSPFSTDLNTAYQSSPLSAQQGGLDSKFDASMAHGLPPQSSMADLSSMSGMMMPSNHRPSIGSVGAQPFQHRTGSIGGSEAWSPTSSRQGQNTSDENLASQTGNKKLSNKSHDQHDQDHDEEDMEKPPPWSELKTKAGKERKRLPLACIACRRKKIRCSGEKPACKHCLRSRIPCVYKVTTRKAAPRTDYMAMLDKRLKRMEERVIKIVPKDELPDSSTTGRAVVKPALPSTSSKPVKPPMSKKRSADEAFVIELNQWTQPLTHRATESSGTQRPSKGEENKLLTEGIESLPPMELQQHLAEVFFDCIYGQSYLLLHKPSFMRRLATGNVPPVLMLAVCAISARFSTHPSLNTSPNFLRGESWASPARAIVERRHFQPNITILTVMLILGLHYFGTCEGGLSWSFGGQAMRMAYALQLHRELDHDPLGRTKDKSSELSFTDREIRRRTMWACFLMDRFNASGTERPPFGNEEYMHIQLPVKEAQFQMEIPGVTENLDGQVQNPVSPGMGQVTDPKENMGVAAYVIRAVVLWGRIVKYLNLGGKEKDPYPLWSPDSQFALLRKQVEDFQQSLPPLLHYNSENLQNHASERVANQFIYMHIIVQQNILFLNRFAIPVSPGARPPKDMPKQFLSDAGRVAVEAANKASKLIDEAAPYQLTVPFAGYCSYAAATVHVWGIFSKNPQLEESSKENLRYCYKYLNKMKKYWGMFHYMAESVKQIYRHFADASRQPELAASGDQEAPMFQYGDWFDKYPLGVPRSDYEEMQNEIKREPGTEAVMSKQSDLQSVEEFFASLSPPSKAETSRKVAKKHNKSSSQSAATSRKANAGNAKNQNNAAVNEHSKQSHNQHRGSFSVPAKPEPLPTLDTSVPTEFQHQPPSATSITTPQTLFSSQSQQHQNPFTPGFDFSPAQTQPPFYPVANHLPQLDRQLVMGAYAGIDQPGVGGMNYWEGLDLNGFGGGGAGAGNPGHASYNEATSAWFMPFNMEPPVIGDENNFGGMGGMGDLGGNGAFGGIGEGFGNGPGPGPPPGSQGQGEGMGGNGG
ncbi:MAG: hypothetical protein Q9227_001154 [Pyrenula ochraceoflavens]